MSILIKGMKMPTRCGRCDMCIPVFDDGMFEHYECCITAATIDNRGEKMEDCPLVEIPPHGRLIDADVLGLTDFEIIMCNGNYKNGLEMLLRKIDNAPTIISAEEGE